MQGRETPALPRATVRKKTMSTFNFRVSHIAKEFRAEVVTKLNESCGHFHGERRIKGTPDTYALTFGNVCLVFKLDTSTRMGDLLAVHGTATPYTDKQVPEHSAGKFLLNSAEMDDASVLQGDDFFSAVNAYAMKFASMQKAPEKVAEDKPPVQVSPAREAPQVRNLASLYTRVLAGRMFMAKVEGGLILLSAADSTTRQTMAALKTQVSRTLGKDCEGVSQNDDGVISINPAKLGGAAELLSKLNFSAM